MQNYYYRTILNSCRKCHVEIYTQKCSTQDLQYNQPFTQLHVGAKNAIGLNWSSVYYFSIHVFGGGTDYRSILFSPEMLGMNDEAHFYQLGFNQE
jgi:hypothetical protein